MSFPDVPLSATASWGTGAVKTAITRALMTTFVTNPLNALATRLLLVQSFVGACAEIASSVQGFTNNTITTVGWGGATISDSGGSLSTVLGGSFTSGTGIKILVAGVYELSATLNFPSNSTGIREMWCLWTPAVGTAVNIGRDAVTAVTGQDTTVSLAPGAKITAAIGDVVQIQARQSSGGTLTLTANGSGDAGFKNFFNVKRVQ